MAGWLRLPGTRTLLWCVLAMVVTYYVLYGREMKLWKEEKKSEREIEKETTSNLVLPPHATPPPSHTHTDSDPTSPPSPSSSTSSHRMTITPTHYPEDSSSPKSTSSPSSPPPPSTSSPISSTSNTTHTDPGPTNPPLVDNRPGRTKNEITVLVLEPSGWWFNGQHDFTCAEMGLKQCLFTTDYNAYIDKAHATMREFFYWEDEHIKAIHRPQGFPGQKKIFFSLEAMNLEPSKLNKQGYDMTVGYAREHDLFVTYAGVVTSGRDLVTGQFFNNSKEQDPKNMAIFINSACVGDRQDYVKELMNHMPVLSIGGCLKNGDQWPYEGGCSGLPRYEFKICIMSKFKFYLAFENTITPDYVTEKFYGAFMAGTIPVYRGAPNIEDFSPGDHSFINVLDYKTPKDLADYILYLNNNQTAYNEYFEWRTKPLKQTYLDKWNQRVESMFCRICDKLSYMDFSS